MAELKDFGAVKSWYDAYKRVLGEAEDKKKEDEKKKSPVEVLPKENGEKEEEKQPEGESVEKLKAEIERLKGEVQKKDLEVKKKDAETTVEPNPETGEVPLRVGIAQSILDKKKKKEVKEELEEATVSVFDISYDDVPKSKLTQAAKKFGIKMKKLPKNKVSFGGDDAIEFSGSDSNLLKFAKAQFGTTARNVRDLKKELEEQINEMSKDKAYAIGMSTAKKKYEDEPPLDKKTITKGHEIAKKLMKKESLDESPVVDYARKLSSYAVKRGGIDRKDFMKIADRISKAKNDLDMKKIGKQVDDMDTEPRDLIKGSIALQMGPKTYKTMFGDRLTASDMNQYKKMTPRDMREETLDELKEPFIVVDTAQGNKVVGMASDEKEAQSIISSSERPPMRIKNKKTLKIVKVRKKQMIGRPLKEESLDEVNKDAVGTITSKQMNSLKKSYNSLPDRIDPEKAMALAKMLDRFGEGELRQLTHAGIKFISTLAINKLIMKHKYKAKDIHDIRKAK